MHSKLETLHVKNRLEGLNREVAVIKTEQLELMNTVFERFYNSSQRVHVDHRLSNNTTATQTPKSSSGPRIPWDNNTSITTPFYHARTRSLLPRLLSPLPPPFAPPPSESSLESSSTSSSSSSSSPLPSPSQQKLPSTLSRGGDGAPFCDDSVGGGEGMNYEQKDITPAPSASPTPSHATKTTTQDHTQVMTAAVGSFTMSSLLESDHQRPLPLVSINNNNSTVISSQFTDFEKTVAKITTNESADGTLVDGKEADVKKRGLMHLLDHGFVGNGNIGDGESEWPRLTANSWVAEDEQMVVMEEMISGRSLLTKKTDADGSSLSALVSDLLLATNTEVVEGLAAAAELVVEEEEVINLKMSFAESLADDCFQD